MHVRHRSHVFLRDTIWLKIVHQLKWFFQKFQKLHLNSPFQIWSSFLATPLRFAVFELLCMRTCGGRAFWKSKNWCQNHKSNSHSTFEHTDQFSSTSWTTLTSHVWPENAMVKRHSFPAFFSQSENHDCAVTEKETNCSPSQKRSGVGRKGDQIWNQLVKLRKVHVLFWIFKNFQIFTFGVRAHVHQKYMCLTTRIDIWNAARTRATRRLRWS